MDYQARTWAACAALTLAVAIGGCGGTAGTPNVVYTGTRSTPGGSPTPSAAPTTTPSAAPTSTPTTVPTATPTPTPSAAPTSSPGAIQLNPTTVSPTPQQGACAAIDASFTATESGYTGNFNAVSNNTSVATVSPATSSGSFSVHAVASSGSTTITVSDANGHVATENVQIPNVTCLP